MLNRIGILKSLTLVSLICGIGSAEAVSANAPPATPKTSERFCVGVCTHFSQDKGIVEMNLQSIKNAGITAIRDETTWSAVERQKGTAN